MERAMEPFAVSPTEAARLLGVSKPKVYDLIRSEGFPAFKLGGRVLVSVDGLRDWVKNQTEVRV